MTGPPPASPPPAGDLPARLFRALYQGYDLHPAGGAWFAVISVAADVTIWTDGTRFWCTVRGQRSTWPAADTEAAAAGIAALTRPEPDS